jgi:hypothetical protein
MKPNISVPAIATKGGHGWWGSLDIPEQKTLKIALLLNFV